jgi:hypothetical protein
MPAVPGGAAAFRANPVTYLTTYPSILSAVGGIEAAINDFAWQLNPGNPVTRDWLRCTPKAAAFADIQAWSPAGLCAGARELRIIGAVAEAGVRYLPYQADKLSYMRLDVAAQWIYTGPIEGCFVYVVTHGGHTYLFHVNANIVAGAHANALAKDTKLRAALNTLLPGGVVVNRLARDDYAPPAGDHRPFRGFVWGQLTGGGWVFRYHSFIINGAVPIALHHAPLLPNAAGMLA